MSGFKESAGTMTLYIKMNRHLQMMLQHGLFHLHIIVIVILEEKVWRGRQIEREGGSGSGHQDERDIGSGSGQRESGGGSGLINQNEEERGGGSGGNRRLVEGSGQTEEPRRDKGKGTSISSISNILNP